MCTCRKTYIEVRGAVQQVRQIEVLDVVSGDDVRIHVAYELRPFLQQKRDETLRKRHIRCAAVALQSDDNFAKSVTDVVTRSSAQICG